MQHIVKKMRDLAFTITTIAILANLAKTGRLHCSYHFKYFRLIFFCVLGFCYNINLISNSPLVAKNVLEINGTLMEGGSIARKQRYTVEIYLGNHEDPVWVSNIFNQFNQNF